MSLMTASMRAPSATCTMSAEAVAALNADATPSSVLRRGSRLMTIWRALSAVCCAVLMAAFMAPLMVLKMPRFMRG
jgi:hypothetical protein